MCVYVLCAVSDVVYTIRTNMFYMFKYTFRVLLYLLLVLLYNYNFVYLECYMCLKKEEQLV